MDAGITGEAHQHHIGVDDTAGVTLGSGGQLQIGDDEGNLSQPSDPDSTSPDDHQQVPALDSPPPTLPITDSPPPTPSSAPELPSESMLPDMISQIDYSWTETPSIPTAILTAPTTVDFPTDLPLTPIPISFDTILSNPAQSAISSSPSSQSSTLTSNSFSSSAVPHSISVSSTISQQPSSETVIAPPIPANLNVHPATFYVGISLGSLVAVALVTALIAWWIRRKTRRRRSAQTIVPWGHPDDYDDRGLESGRNASEMDDDTLAALNLGSREDLAHIQAWSSHRDRDVGEPKHAPTDPNTFLYGSNPYGRPRRTLYTDQGYGYPNTEYSSNPAPRHLPSHLIPDDISARAHQRENSLYTRNTVSSGMDRAYGDPRRTAAWQQESLPEGPLSRSMADRLRNVGKHSADDDPDRLPSPTGPTLGKEEFEQWSTSLKSSLVNAFNAVASNLGGTAPRLKDEDGLTAPPKRSIRRRKATASYKGKGDGSGISRRGSVATTASKPWTLEEIADGAGVVHLHLPEIEEHEHASQRPPLHRPTLSFGDGENISMDNNAKAGRQNFQSRDPQIELFASSKPKRAFIRPETYFARQKSTETVNAKSVSRASSIYSTQSAHSGALPRRGASRRSRLPLPKSNLPPRGHLDHEESDSVVIAPDTISRLSSTDSSLMMLSAEGSLLGPRSHTDAAASRALKERQKKVIEAQTAQSLSK